MEVKRICQWCGKPFMAKKTTTNYCSPQCSKRGYKHRMKERRMEMRKFQEMLEVKSKLESQENLMKFSDPKMNLTLPSIIPLNRLRRSTKSTLNGCGPIPDKTMFPKSESASSIITVKST